MLGSCNSDDQCPTFGASATERASSHKGVRSGIVSCSSIIWNFRRFSLDSVVWYRVYSFLEGVRAMEVFSIGQVARLSGVGIETIRFYA
jgi:hypothetical protein